jgi:hypothetical protein
MLTLHDSWSLCPYKVLFFTLKEQVTSILLVYLLCFQGSGYNRWHVKLLGTTESVTH